VSKHVPAKCLTLITDIDYLFQVNIQRGIRQSPSAHATRDSSLCRQSTILPFALIFLRPPFPKWQKIFNLRRIPAQLNGSLVVPLSHLFILFWPWIIYLSSFLCTTFSSPEVSEDGCTSHLFAFFFFLPPAPCQLKRNGIRETPTQPSLSFLKQFLNLLTA